MVGNLLPCRTFYGFHPVRDIKRWHLNREFLSLRKYHPWCPYNLYSGQSAKLLSCINYIDTIQPFFISPAAKIAYFFCFRAACLAWAAFADIMPASISLGTMIFAPKGLTTMPSAGQIFPLGSLRSIMAA